jgi:hypothetical protein
MDDLFCAAFYRYALLNETLFILLVIVDLCEIAFTASSAIWTVVAYVIEIKYDREKGDEERHDAFKIKGLSGIY